MFLFCGDSRELKFKELGFFERWSCGSNGIFDRIWGFLEFFVGVG